MKNLFAIILFFFMGNVNHQSNVIYVSPAGNDDKPGTLEQPLQSLQAALKKVASIPSEKVIIRLRKGNYAPTKTIVISPDLLNGRQLEIEAYKNEWVNLQGSKLMKPEWKAWENNILRAKIEKGLIIDQLYANGKALNPARYPNKDTSQKVFNGTAPDAISTDRVKSWENPAGAYVHALHKGMWGGFHYLITGEDDNGNLELKGGWQNNRPSPMHEQYRFVENVFEELDAPGEWYYDKESGFMYLFPDKEMNLSSTRFERSVLNNIIELHGTEHEPVKNLSIANINFSGTNRTFMLTKEPLLRSDWTIYRGGAILIEGGENISISHCDFSQLGGNAVFVSNYNRNVNISNNHIHHIGASAIAFVGNPGAVRSPSFQYGDFVPASEIDTVPGPKTNTYPANCLVENNLIHHIGTVEKQVAGVQISMSSSITVSHNSIYHVPRAGINIGDGTWGGHLIEYNDVFATVLETSDHGAFNSWGRDRFWHPNRKTMDSLVKVHPNWVKLDAIEPTIIRNNRFRCDHGWDIDLDDGSTNYIIYNNLCLSGGIKLREGFYRRVYNNIMLNNGFHPHVWFENSHDVFKHNIVMARHRDIFLQGWGDTIDSNFFVNNNDLRYSLSKGLDSNSISRKPYFVDAPNGNFSVKPDSKALKVGFHNFPMDQFGVTNKQLKVIAARPIIPQTLFADEQKDEAKTHQWLGASLKNVESLAEQSAAGLNEIKGVLLLDVAVGSTAQKSGLKKGDVILKYEGANIASITDLIKIWQGNQWKNQVSVSVFRNQSLHEVNIKIK